MKLTIEKLRKMIKEAAMLTIVEPTIKADSNSNSDTPGMFPGMSDIGLGTEEGGSTMTPSCDDSPKPTDIAPVDLKDVVKTTIAKVVMEQTNKNGRKAKS